MCYFSSEAKLTRKYYNQVDISQHKLASKRKSKSKARRTKSKARRKTSKPRRSKSKAKSRSSSKKKSGSKKKPFGGYGINFSGRTETVEQVFGRGKVTPSEMTKKLWKFVKAKRLSTR